MSQKRKQDFIHWVQVLIVFLQVNESNVAYQGMGYKCNLQFMFSVDVASKLADESQINQLTFSSLRFFRGQWANYGPNVCVLSKFICWNPHHMPNLLEPEFGNPQPPELWEIKFHCLEATWPVVLCCSILQRLRWMKS